MVLEVLSRKYDDTVQYRKSRIQIWATVIRLFLLLVSFVFPFIVFNSENPFQLNYLLIASLSLILEFSGIYLNYLGRLKSSMALSIITNHLIHTFALLTVDQSEQFLIVGSYYISNILFASLFFNIPIIIITGILTIITVLLLPITSIYPVREASILSLYLVVISGFFMFTKYLSEQTADDLTQKVRLDEYYSKMESLGVLTAGVAHDFNNLLMAAINQVELLSYDIKQSEKDELINNLKRTLQTGTEVVKQLLLFTQTKQGDYRRLLIKDFLNHNEYLLKTIVGKNIQLTFDIHESHEIVISPPKLTQILLNLLVNSTEAIKKSGNIIISSKLILEGDQIDRLNLKNENNYLELKIEDDGEGIADDQINNIFNPFYSSKKSYNSNGLGLFTIYYILNDLGGAITADSEINVGTTFRLYFPIEN